VINGGGKGGGGVSLFDCLLLQQYCLDREMNDPNSIENTKQSHNETPPPPLPPPLITVKDNIKKNQRTLQSQNSNFLGTL